MVGMHKELEIVNLRIDLARIHHFKILTHVQNSCYSYIMYTAAGM